MAVRLHADERCPVSPECVRLRYVSAGSGRRSAEVKSNFVDVLYAVHVGDC